MRNISRSFLPLLCFVVGTSPCLGASSNELVNNGGFELGDTTSWASVPTASSTFGVTSDASSGSFGGELFNDDLATAAVIAQNGLGVGSVSPGDVLHISFAAKGSFTTGGIAFGNVVSVTAGGLASGSTLLSGGPLALTGDWQTFCFTTNAGPDVEGGITLQFAAVAAAAGGSASTLFIDDVSIKIAELTTNGDFEAGDTGSWLSTPTANSSFGVTADANGGSFAGELVNDEPGTAAVISQNDLGIGGVSPGDVLTVSFVAKGSSALGGIAFANFISVTAGGQASSSELLGGGALPLTSTWQNYSYMVTAGPDADGGVILQLAAVTGTDVGSTSTLLVDDVTITSNEGSTMNYCVLSPNAVGPGAYMSSSGSTSIAADDFVIEVNGVPPGEFFIFWVGQGAAYAPSFNGIICIGAPCRLYFPGQATAGGFGSKPLPASEYTFSGCTPPSVGTSYNYQCVYRDIGGAGVNWSDALCVTFGL